MTGCCDSALCWEQLEGAEPGLGRAPGKSVLLPAVAGLSIKARTGPPASSGAGWAAAVWEQEALLRRGLRLPPFWAVTLWAEVH